MTVENAADQAALLEDFGESFKYTPAAYIADHPYSTQTQTIIMLFDNMYHEFDGIGGLFPTISGFNTGEIGGEITRIDDGANYYVRSIQNDGTGFYLWILEYIT